MIAEAFHHTAITVGNIERSIAFYEAIGFKQTHRYDRPDVDKTMVHLALGDVFIELYRYGNDRDFMPKDFDFEKEIGLKHIALAVRSVDRAYQVLLDQGLDTKGREPAVSNSDSKIKYVFTKDPDGNWVEFIEDTRSVDFVETQIAVKAVIENDGRFLILREGENWQAPGGRLEAGESLKDGILREIKEETGIEEVDILGVVHVDEFNARPGGVLKNIVATFYHCRTVVEEVDLMPMEHEEYRWVNLEELDSMVDKVKPEIAKAIKKAAS